MSAKAKIAIRHDYANHARTRKAYAKLVGHDVTSPITFPASSRLAAKFNATHVPYTGVAEALTDTIAGPVPTPVEAGLPNVEYEGWCGIAPGKVPRPIIAKISKEMAPILKPPEIKESIIGIGIGVTLQWTPPEALALLNTHRS